MIRNPYNFIKDIAYLLLVKVDMSELTGMV